LGFRVWGLELRGANPFDDAIGHDVVFGLMFGV